MIVSTQYLLTSSTDPETNTTTDSAACVMNNQLLIYWMDLLNSTVVPFIFMLALSVLIIRCINQTRRNVVNSNKSNNSLISLSVAKKIHTRDRKFASMSISLNIVFIVVGLPVAINNLVSTYVDESPHVEQLTTQLFRLLYFAYFASDFYTQLAVNMIFRKVFLRMFGLKPILNNSSDVIDRLN